MNKLKIPICIQIKILLYNIWAYSVYIDYKVINFLYDINFISYYYFFPIMYNREDKIQYIKIKQQKMLHKIGQKYNKYFNDIESKTWDEL